MNGPFVQLNGELVSADEARVSALDAGFLYGDGIYETMRAYGGRVFAWERHFARLTRSAAQIQLSVPPEPDLRRAIEQTLDANRTPSATVRITVTRGRLDRRLDLSSAGSPTVLVASDSVDDQADRKRRAGVRVVYSRFLRLSAYPLAGVKSTNYQVSLFARNEAREAGALEVLVPNESGDIVEAAAANVFLVEGKAIFTPPLSSGILGGITREVVMELASKSGVAVTEETLPRERIHAADELFLTGTTIQVAPVVEVGDHKIGDGRPGDLTIRLLDAYLDAVRADVAPVTPSASPDERQ